MIFRRNFSKYWLPVILWMGFIYWMSTDTFSSQNTFSWVEIALRFWVPNISFQEMVSLHTFIRKTAHVTEYFVLGLLLFRTFRGGSVPHGAGDGLSSLSSSLPFGLQAMSFTNPLFQAGRHPLGMWPSIQQVGFLHSV